MLKQQHSNTIYLLLFFLLSFFLSSFVFAPTGLTPTAFLALSAWWEMFTWEIFGIQWPLAWNQGKTELFVSTELKHYTVSQECLKTTIYIVI